MKSAPHETKIFIAGSRRLSRLGAGVRRRIDTIIDKGFTVILGDANGADKSVQQYLHDKHSKNVIVFCMEGGCRNNVGAWSTRTVKAVDPGHRDFTYYSTKDRAMAAEADYALMLWDGQSRGTLRNVVDLVQRGKPVVLYLAPQKSFETLRHKNDLDRILSHIDVPATGRGGDAAENSHARNGSRRKLAAEQLF